MFPTKLKHLNDNRPPGGPGTERLAFAVRLRFAFAAGPCRVVNQVWLHSPRETKPWGTYEVPLGRTATWWSTRWPVSGRLTDAKFHSHQSRFSSGFLVRGGVSQFLGERACGGLEAATKYALRGDALGDLEAALRSGANRTVCRVEGASAQVGGARYARRADVSCAPAAKFRKGEMFSFVAFHAPNWGADAPVVDMHDILWINLDSKSRRSVSVPLAATDVNSCGAAVSDVDDGPHAGARPTDDVFFWSARAKQVLDDILGLGGGRRRRRR